MRFALLVILAGVVTLADIGDRVTGWASVGPATIAYMVNGGGRDLPVFRRPSLKELPNGYWGEGTRVEVLSGAIVAGGQRWTRVRGPSNFEAYALSRTLSSDPPRSSMDAGFAQTANYTTAARWEGTYTFCVNGKGGPRNLPPLLVHDAATRAGGLWTDATDRNVRFVDDGDCDDVDGTLHRDGISVISWGDPKDEKGRPLFGMSYPRVAGTRIVEVDIVLSARLLARGQTTGPGWLNKRASWSCLVDTVTHEFGHVVGLGHAPEGTLSVMRPGTNCMRTVYLPDIDKLNASRLFAR